MVSSAGGVPGWFVADWGVRTYALADRSWRILDYTVANLKDAGRGVTGTQTRRVSAFLVTAEVALAVVVLGGAGVMARSLRNLYTMNRGFSASNFLIVNVGRTPRSGS